MANECEHARGYSATTRSGFVTLTAHGLHPAGGTHKAELSIVPNSCPPKFDLKHSQQPNQPEGPFAVSLTAPVPVGLTITAVEVTDGRGTHIVPLASLVSGEPLVKIDPQGSGAILRYDVPDTTSYSGRNYIDLNIDQSWFQEKPLQQPEHALRKVVPNYTLETLSKLIRRQIQSGAAELRNFKVSVDDIRLSLRAPRIGPGDPPNPTLSSELGSQFPAAPSLPVGGSPEIPKPITPPVQPFPQQPGLIRTAAAEAVQVADSSQVGSISHLAYAWVNRLGLTPELIAERYLEYRPIQVYRNLYGNYTYAFGPPEPDVVDKEKPLLRGRLVLVESYVFASYFGDYGAGRTLKTFSLLPGERTKLSVRTYTKREQEAKQASSIFDSFTEESAAEFMTSLTSEQSDKRTYEESLSWNVSTSASASWFVFEASVGGGVSGASRSAREQFGRAVYNTSSKHAAKASAKRDIQINTSYEERTLEEQENSIVREIENVNVGRTLNFVFRQLNQEFVSVLYLADVRLGFTNGVDYDEVSLHDVDRFLERYFVEKVGNVEPRREIRKLILDLYTAVADYKDVPRRFVEEVGVPTFGPPTVTTLPDEILNCGKWPPGSQTSPPAATGKDRNYIRVIRDITCALKEHPHIVVPGIPIRVDKHVLRTEGVIVESVLGQGQGLDPYSHGLQLESIRERQLQNDVTEAALEIVRQAETPAKKVEYWKQLFPALCCPPPKPDPSTGSGGGIPASGQ